MKDVYKLVKAFWLHGKLLRPRRIEGRGDDTRNQRESGLKNIRTGWVGRHGGMGRTWKVG